MEVCYTVRDKADIENSMFNISETVLHLENDKYVIALEVGIVESDMIQQVIDSCYEKLQELNAEKEIG